MQDVGRMPKAPILVPKFNFDMPYAILQIIIVLILCKSCGIKIQVTSKCVILLFFKLLAKSCSVKVLLQIIQWHQNVDMAIL